MDEHDPPGQGIDIPRWIRKYGAIAWRLVGMAAAVTLVAFLIARLTTLVVAVAVALLLTAVLDPIVRRLDRPGWPDWIVPFVTVLAVLGSLGWAVAELGDEASEQLPQLEDDLRSSVQELEQVTGIELTGVPGLGSLQSGQGSGSSGSGGGESNGSQDSSGSNSQQGGGSGVSQADATRALQVGAEVLFGIFLTFALAFLFLKDGPAMWAWLLGKVSPARRAEIDEAGRAAWATMGTYVRGLTVVAIFDAVGIAIGLLILGVPLVATLAALQFFASYVPTIGAFVAGGVAAIVALGSGGLVTAALTVGVVVLVQQIGNNIIEPWIMGRGLPLHPAMVLIAVTAGALLWGIAGALLFVPLAAGFSAAGHVLWQRRHPAG